MTTLLPAIRAVRWAITPPYLAAMLTIARAGHGPDGGITEAAARREARSQRRQAGMQPTETLPGTFNVRMQGETAIIPIDGPIFRRANLFMDVSGGTSTEYLSHDIQTALASDRVRSILLLIDSPGGEAKGIHELAQQIYAGRSTKPIHAYTDGDCCSGAYWLAAAAQHITLDDSALIGSVGVVLTVDDPASPLNDDGTIEIVSSMSVRKRPDPTTDDGRAALQTIVDDLGWLFVDRVAEYRNLDRDSITRIQGDVLVGQRAVAAHFADALGSYATALSACQQAGQLIPVGAMAHSPVVQQEEPMHPEDEALLEATLTQPTPLETRVAALEARVQEQQALIVSLQTQATLVQELAGSMRDAQTRLARLEGDAPTIAGGYRASMQAAPETDAAVLTQAPGGDALDAFLSKR